MVAHRCWPLLAVLVVVACKPPPPVAPPRSPVVDNPKPPADVADALEQHFPLAAALDGRSGSADVLLNVKKNGLASPRKMLKESAPGFGRACARAMRATRWNPARQQNGQYLDYRVYYTCNFTFEASPDAPEVRSVEAEKEWKAPGLSLALAATKLTTQGELSPEQLGPQLGPRFADLLQCFEGAASGDYRLSLLVDSAGSVSRAELVYAASGQDKACDCVEERVMKWTLPASGPQPTLVDIALKMRGIR